MKINPAPLHHAQSIIIGICAAMSVAVVGTAGHTLAVFNQQQSSNPWWLPLWPQHFDVHGTKALLGSATATMVLSIGFLVAVFVPSTGVYSRPTLRAMLALGTTLPSALVCLITIIYAHMLNGDTPELDTIQTWTCKYKSSQPLTQEIQTALPSGMGNGNFKSLCMQSKFALYGTLTVFLLLGVSMGLTIVTWLADKWAARQMRKEVEMGQAS